MSSPEVREEELAAAARSARASAYAPYSRFPVGAAVQGASGRIYRGCNVENASYGLTMCAEQVAVAGAVAEGEREIVAAAVHAEAEGPVWPCGRCRQVLAEFGPDMLVICDRGDAPPLRARLSELLPRAFAGAAFAREA